jgi:hypothetical protein
MFEANSQLKLLPPSLLDIYKVFEHIYMLSICIFNWHTVEVLNSFTHTPRRRLPPCQCCRPRCVGVSSHHAGIVDCTGIINLFVLASWPSLCWCCRPCCDGIIDLVALVLPLSAVWSMNKNQRFACPLIRHLWVWCTPKCIKNL